MLPASALAFLALAAVPARPADSAALARRITSAISGSETARRASWGIRVADGASEKTLFELNASHFFVPASNTKLYSTALALDRLGPDYRFRTTVCGPLPAGGVVRGELRLVGSGDPTLSGRVYPYEKRTKESDPLAAIASLADQLVLKGIREINGDVAGDDTAFPFEPYPAGWGTDDILWSYGAPVSALTISDNTIRLLVRSGERPGDPARLSLSPALEYYDIDSRVTTAAGPRKIETDRIERQLILRGTIPPGDSRQSLLLAIDDPALYAAEALRQALIGRGVIVRGSAVARHRPSPPAGGQVLAERLSPPLSEILQTLDKVSQNLHAELVLREVARVRRGDGSRKAAFDEMKDFLASAGIEPGEVHFEDGSGMSVMTLVTPAASTRLLLHMLKSRHAGAWVGLLPEGGEDGTLAGRFEGKPAARRIHAKTGTLSHVAALSGYADTKAGRRRVFSIMANNFNGPSSDIRRVIDQIALLLVE